MTKEEAITIIDNLHLIGCGRNQHEDDLRINVALDLAIDALLERPKGEWKCMADCGVTECDQCGWSIEEYVGDYNFCPNCGARMENTK